MEYIMKFIVGVLGFFLIWKAVDVGRKDDERINPPAVNFWIAAILIIIGVFLLKYSDIWF